MKTTPFTEKHIALGAKMHEFAGYNMPIEYTDTLTNSYVFINDTGVFNRHIITCKLLHYSAQRYMFLYKRSGFHYLLSIKF